MPLGVVPRPKACLPLEVPNACIGGCAPPVLRYDFGNPVTEVPRGTHIGGCAPPALGYGVVETSLASPFFGGSMTRPYQRLCFAGCLVMF